MPRYGPVMFRYGRRYWRYFRNARNGLGLLRSDLGAVTRLPFSVAGPDWTRSGFVGQQGLEECRLLLCRSRKLHQELHGSIGEEH